MLGALTQAEANVEWGDKTARRFHWRRHEIENYLLHPRVVSALFNDLRVKRIPWAAALPSTEADVSALLQTVATPLLENHAAETLRVELLRCSVSAGNLQFGAIRPPAPPGATVAGQALWVPALQREAARLLTSCAAAIAVPALQANAIAARYQVLLAQYQAPVFLTSGDFLLDMGGHELMAALVAYLRGLGAPPGFTDRFLESELLGALVPIYQPGAIFQPDDFQELASILAQH